MSPLTRNRKPSAWCAPCPRGGEDSSGSAQSRAPACGRARAGSASGRGRPRVARPSARCAARAAGVPPAGGFAPLPSPLRGEAARAGSLGVDRSAAVCYTIVGAHTEVCLKRPGIGACSEISRAFRCVYGRKLPEFHAFHVEFCRFPSNFGENPNHPCPSPRASPERRAARRGGCSRPRARCGGVRRVEQNQVILSNK